MWNHVRMLKYSHAFLLLSLLVVLSEREDETSISLFLWITVTNAKPKTFINETKS